MELSRRDFTKLLAAGIAGGVITHSLIPDMIASAAPTQSPTAEGGNSEECNGMLFDATKCIGCKLCEVACNQVNELPEGKANTLVYLPEVKGDDEPAQVYAKHQCLHCLEPACVEACIVGALKKTPEGPVVYDGDICIGCRYCMVACPFGVPEYEWEKTIPHILKCTFCADRIAEGMDPGCVGACPTKALEFGVRDELIDMAKSRIEEEPEKYINHVYGEYEAGGTSWLYLSSVPFDQIDLPELGTKPVVTNTRRIMSGILPALVTVAATMTGVYWLTGKKGKAKTQDKDRKEVTE